MSTLKRLLSAVMLSGVILFAGLAALTASSPGASAPRPKKCTSCWVPKADDTWQWDLADQPPGSIPPGGKLDRKDLYGRPARLPPVNFIDMDMLNQAGISEADAAATVARYHARGMHVVCYIDVGTWENWRLDAKKFPPALLGKENGWPGERWLDTSSKGHDYANLQRLMAARFKLAAMAGCDAVEPDNIDGSENSTGFKITIAEGDAYAEWVANTVHSLGMSVAQKNFEDQSASLEPYFDFVIEEQCYAYEDCSDLAPYLAAGKGVFDVEYPPHLTSADCPRKHLVAGVNVMLKTEALTAWPRIYCS